ncbi:MAG TPA: SRPBCC family protein [Acidimicrobiales bacterium]
MEDVAPGEPWLLERSVARPLGDGTGAVVSRHTAVIRRSVDVVTRYLFDPTTMPQWSAVLYAIEPTADLEPRVSRRLRANLKILGVRLTVEGELVDVDLAHRAATVRVVPVGTDGVIEHRLSVQPSGDDAVVYFGNRIELPGWLAERVGEGLIRRFVDQTAVFALAVIKAVLEDGEEENLRGLERAAASELPAPQPIDPAPG